MNKTLSGIFITLGTLNWYAPGFNGYFFDPVEVGTGDGHIIGAIFWVGAAILWCMPVRKDD